jgi:hypothetical protein
LGNESIPSTTFLSPNIKAKKSALDLTLTQNVVGYNRQNPVDGGSHLPQTALRCYGLSAAALANRDL